MKTKFVKETDRKGTYIIEGSFDGNKEIHLSSSRTRNRKRNARVS